MYAEAAGGAGRHPWALQTGAVSLGKAWSLQGLLQKTSLSLAHSPPSASLEGRGLSSGQACTPRLRSKLRQKAGGFPVCPHLPKRGGPKHQEAPPANPQQAQEPQEGPQDLCGSPAKARRLLAAIGSAGQQEGREGRQLLTGQASKAKAPGVGVGVSRRTEPSPFPREALPKGATTPTGEPRPGSHSDDAQAR